MGKIKWFEVPQSISTLSLISFVKDQKPNYLIPIKIRTSLIFANLACTKVQRSKFAQYEEKERRKGEEKMP